MVSSPRISIGPAGCRINRDYARRGWATGRRADVRATVPAVQGPLAGPSECSFGARRISSGCWPNWAEGGTETGHPGEGPGACGYSIPERIEHTFRVHRHQLCRLACWILQDISPTSSFACCSPFCLRCLPVACMQCLHVNSDPGPGALSGVTRLGPSLRPVGPTA